MTPTTKDKGVEYGFFCFGATFLHEFVNSVEWIRFDITTEGFKSSYKVYPSLNQRKGDWKSH